MSLVKLNIEYFFSIFMHTFTAFYVSKLFEWISTFAKHVITRTLVYVWFDFKREYRHLFAIDHRSIVGCSIDQEVW